MRLDFNVNEMRILCVIITFIILIMVITSRIILTIYYNDDDVNGYMMMTRIMNISTTC